MLLRPHPPSRVLVLPPFAGTGDPTCYLRNELERYVTLEEGRRGEGGRGEKVSVYKKEPAPATHLPVRVSPTRLESDQLADGARQVAIHASAHDLPDEGGVVEHA